MYTYYYVESEISKGHVAGNVIRLDLTFAQIHKILISPLSPG